MCVGSGVPRTGYTVGTGSLMAKLYDLGSQFLSCPVSGVDQQPLVHSDLFPGVAPTPYRSGSPCEWHAFFPPSTLHHPNLLLLMALSPSADLSELRLLFEPVWLGSLHAVLHPQGPSKGRPRTVPGLLPGCLLLQVLEALLFLQARWHAHGGLSSHAVQLVRPGLAKVGSLEHGRPLHHRWLRPR